MVKCNSSHNHALSLHGVILVRSAKGEVSRASNIPLAFFSEAPKGTKPPYPFGFSWSCSCSTSRFAFWYIATPSNGFSLFDSTVGIHAHAAGSMVSAKRHLAQVLQCTIWLHGVLQAAPGASLAKYHPSKSLSLSIQH